MDEDGVTGDQNPQPPNAVSGETPISDEETLASALALISDAEAALLDVERALERLENGRYASCEVCGSPIDRTTLGAAPATRRCSVHRA